MVTNPVTIGIINNCFIINTAAGGIYSSNNSIFVRTEHKIKCQLLVISLLISAVPRMVVQRLSKI